MTPNFGLIIIGDEILSGKRVDKHLPKVIELLAARGLPLAYADYVGDDPARITATLARAFAASRASGAIFVALAPVLVPLAIWIYALVFAFSSLWFAHYCLSALEQLRKINNPVAQATRAQYATDLIVNQPLADALPKPVPGYGASGGPLDF